MNKTIGTLIILVFLVLLSTGCPPPGGSKPINLWTWVSGSDVTYQSGTYGTKGTADPANIPGARWSSISWTDSAGNFWLFGGYGLDSAGTHSYLNDLWKFDNTNWTWISGSNIVNQSGTYGTKGVAAAANVPGARSGSIGWIDADDNLWLFGGAGYDSGGVWGQLNDLWRFDGVNWTWVSGSSSADQNASYGTKGVADAANIPGGRDTSISWIDSAGNLWLFGGYGLNGAGSVGRLNDLWRFDGVNWTWISGSNTINQIGTYGTKGVAHATNIPGSRRKSTGWIDSDQSLWLFGGSGYANNGTLGYLNDLWKFDGVNWTWISGSNIVNQSGTYGSKGTADTANIPGGRWFSISWIDSSDNLRLFGGNGYDSTGTVSYLNDLWKFDGTNWTWISGSNIVNQSGSYGIKGQEDAANMPGARRAGGNWITSGRILWLFGGEGYDSVGDFSLLNDLWKIQVK